MHIARNQRVEYGNHKTISNYLFNHKCEHYHRLDIGFAVHKLIIHSVKEFIDVNPRLSMLILKIENFNIILINVHAHTEDKDEEEKEIFYVTLEDVLSTSRGQVKLITKNLNVN